MGWAAMTSHARRQAIYATIWRWHFYAGLFVITFVLLLAVTGAAYLCKTQVERSEERAFQNLPTERAICTHAQLDEALAPFSDDTLANYSLHDLSGEDRKTDVQGKSEYGRGQNR